MTSKSQKFFKAQEEQSAIKAEIVAKYFKPWANIILSQANEAAYLDLYCGPGRFEDGSKSTPLLVVDQILADRKLQDRIALIFNDANTEFVNKIKAELESVPGILRIKHGYAVYNEEINDEFAKTFEDVQTIPLLTFLDPWGYKGLSRRLVENLIKGWGSEVIVFLNYDRVNAAITNGLVGPIIGGLLGKERHERLKVEVRGLNPRQREIRLMQEIAASFRELGGLYQLPFRIERKKKKKHYICHVSKSPKGYQVMKDIMANLGYKDEDGVPEFQYYPPRLVQQIDLGFNPRPIELLKDSLLRDFRGQRRSMKDVFATHNVGTNYVRPNYVRVLLDLESEGIITCVPDILTRRKGTFADTTMIHFPA